MTQKWIILLLFVMFTASMFAQEKDMNADSSQSEITFVESNWNKVLSEAKASRKYIFVDAYASWCAPCRLLKSTTFKDKNVTAFFNKHFINASFDMEKGEGISLADKWHVDAYPSLMIFNSNGKIVLEKTGYVEANELIDFAEKALSESATD